MVDTIERYVYSPYGVITTYDATWSNIRSSSTYDNEYTYTGRRLDKETGIYQYRHRVYEAGLGRFASRDPIGYETRGWGLYVYVGSRPVINVDPTGMIPPGFGAWELPGRPFVPTLQPPRKPYNALPRPGHVLPFPPVLPGPPRVSAPIVFLWVWLTPTETGLDAEIRIPIDIGDDEEKERSCATEYPNWPVCPEELYEDKKIACRECNRAGFKPDNPTVVDSPHFWASAVHWSCLCSGRGRRIERLGCSVICGSCCSENNGDPVLDDGCICAETVYDYD